MLTILAITFPFFALVLCGYLAVRRALLPLAAIPGLNSFVLYFALPCMLYRFGATTPLAQLLDASVFGVYLLCALVMVGVTMAVTLSHRIGWNNAAFGALVAAFPEHGLHGRAAAGGPAGAAVVGPGDRHHRGRHGDHQLAVHRPVARGSGGAHGSRAAVVNALKGMAGNPDAVGDPAGRAGVVAVMACPSP